MPQVVGGELRLVSLRAEPAGRGHDPGVVDQDIDPAAEVGGEGCHRVQVEQIEVADLEIGAGMRVGDGGGGRAGLGLVADGHDHVRALGGERPRGSQAEAVAGPGDQDAAPGLVGYVVCGPFSAHDGSSEVV
ncbi:hypothetical protein GCM10029992_34170 [Glycomyces albus]